MKIIHVINSTDIGGAENILFNLVKSQSNQEVIMISATSTPVLIIPIVDTPTTGTHELINRIKKK